MNQESFAEVDLSMLQQDSYAPVSDSSMGRMTGACSQEAQGHAMSPQASQASQESFAVVDLSMLQQDSFAEDGPAAGGSAARSRSASHSSPKDFHSCSSGSEGTQAVLA